MRKLAVVNTQGQALIELILAISLASFFLTTFVVGIISVREAFNHSSVSAEAKALLQREIEALRSIKETSWNSFATGSTYHVVPSGNTWTAVSGTVIDNKLTHGFTVAAVCRLQATSPPVDCATPGSIPDPATKKITATVSWSLLGTESISSSLYLTRHAGNTVWTQTTQADFNTGTTNSTVVTSGGSGIAGAVELAASAGAGVDYGNKFRVLSQSSIGAMTTTGHKTSIRFTAQTTKTVRAVRVYLSQEQGSSPSYRYGLQADSGGNPSGVFLGSNTSAATTTGWKTVVLATPVNVTAGTVYHLVVEPWGTPIPSRYINLAATTPLNSLIVKTQTIDSSSNTLFKAGSSATWVIQGKQPLYELDYSDATNEGNPFFNTALSTIFGNNWFGEKFTVSGGSKTVTAISFIVAKNGTGTPLDNLYVELRDAATNSTIESGILTAASSTSTLFLNKTYTFSTPRTLTNGSTYRIILKSPLSNSTNNYRVYRAVGTNSANYNSITYDGTSSIYTLSTNGGSTWNDTNLNMDISSFYFTTSASTNYSTTGDFTSPAVGGFDTLGASAFNYLDWTATIPANTNLTFQLAINNDNLTWNYFGPDGTVATYFTTPASIPITKINGRYVRYKVFFTGDGTTTPTLSDLSINYSP